MRISDWSSDVCSSDLSFSLRKGQPPYVEAYQQRADRDADRRSEDKVLLGYVFLSTDIVDIPGYSGQPIVTLIGMEGSEERRVGKGCVGTCRFRWTPYHEKKNMETSRLHTKNKV